MNKQIGNGVPVYPEWLGHYQFDCSMALGAFVFCTICSWRQSLDCTDARELYGMIRTHWREQHKEYQP